MPSLQLNLEGGQLFCPTEVKVTNEWTGFCYQHIFSLEVVAILMIIYPCNDMSSVIFDTNQDEDKSNFLFLPGDGVSG